jgi:hypothetical protein
MVTPSLRRKRPMADTTGKEPWQNDAEKWTSPPVGGAQTAYSSYRGGFRQGAPAPPHWDDLEPWVRDALKAAYLQGVLNGAHNSGLDEALNSGDGTYRP